MKITKNPTRKTLYRARKYPEKSSAVALCTLANQQGCSPNELLKMPLYFQNRRIDGVVDVGDKTYCYTVDLPYNPSRRIKYVVENDDGTISVVKRYTVKKRRIIGAVTLEVTYPLLERWQDPDGNEVKDDDKTAYLRQWFSDDV